MDENIRPKNDRDLDSSCETPDDDHAAVNASAAAQIMRDPAGAAGTAPRAAVLVAPEGSGEMVQKAIIALPGLVGAIDEALRHEVVTQGIPFTFIMWVPSGDGRQQVIHASNFNPEAAKQGLIDFGKTLETQEPESEHVPPTTNDAPPIVQ